MRILVDVDGVIADWGLAYGESLDAAGPAAANIPRHEAQTSFDLFDGRTPEEKAIIKSVMQEPGFYSRLTQIPGAKTALRALLAAGHDVRLVTSPYISNPTCASDKLNWVCVNYGSHWAARTILTNDKTLVRGDVLIDDKPEVTGTVASPEWLHAVFTQPYNIDAPADLRLDGWEGFDPDGFVRRVRKARFVQLRHFDETHPQPFVDVDNEEPFPGAFMEAAPL